VSELLMLRLDLLCRIFPKRSGNLPGSLSGYLTADDISGHTRKYIGLVFPVVLFQLAEVLQPEAGSNKSQSADY